MSVMTHVNAEKVAETAHGRKYGYFLRNPEFPKVSGKRSAGRDSDPPIIGLYELAFLKQARQKRVSLTRVYYQWTM